MRNGGLTRAHAQHNSAAPAAAAPVADYDHRVVAYYNESEAITREELGDYLVARRGPDKLDALINRHIIDTACKAKNIEVSAAEVETALGESIKGLNIGRERFVKEYLKGIQKSMFEWKEDVLKPRLLLTKLCRDRVQVSEEEIRQAFEATFGEKVECRIIIWPKSGARDEKARMQADLETQARAQANYSQLRDSEEVFAKAAKDQLASALASTGGKVRPVGRNTLSDRVVEDALFKLQPGELTPLLGGKDGITLVKCDHRIPADTTASLEREHGKLLEAVFERKLQVEIGKFIKETREQSAVKPACDTLIEMGMLLRSPGAPGQVLATIQGNVAITRQELAEYLITRYGGESVELLINRKIIEQACKAKGIAISDAEVETAYLDELKRINVDEKKFVEEFLYPNGKSLFEWKEDMLRPKLMMTKLASQETKVTEEDLHLAFEAVHGEKVQGRLILWKPEEKRSILAQYSQLRDSDEAFKAAAHRQFNPALAAKGGEVPAFARHTTGLDKLEDEAFKLQEGEVSSLVDLPEGCAIFKLDHRLAPQSLATFEEKRAELTPMVLERKIQASIPVVFNELRKQASPKSLLKDPNQLEDLATSVQHDLAPTSTPAPSGGLRPRVN